MDMPYQIETVNGKDAVDICKQMREEGEGVFIPVMLGPPSVLEGIMRDFATCDESVESIIERAKDIDIQAILNERIQSAESEYEGVELGAWPDDAQPDNWLMGNLDIVKRCYLDSVVICKVPTPNCWEVPAYFKLGDWNESPAPAVHVAAQRYWFERYDARIITLRDLDTLEFTVGRPPVERDAAIELAWQQFALCPDVVNQGVGSIHSLAASLKSGSTWYLWWD